MAGSDLPDDTIFITPIISRGTEFPIGTTLPTATAAAETPVFLTDNLNEVLLLRHPARRCTFTLAFTANSAQRASSSGSVTRVFSSLWDTGAMPTKIPGSGAEPQQHSGQPTDSAKEPFFRGFLTSGEGFDIIVDIVICSCCSKCV